MKTLSLVIAALVGLSACGGGDVNVTVASDSTATTPAEPAPTRPSEGEAPAEPASPAPSSGVVTEQGFGPVQIGMRAAAAEQALGPIERYGDGTEPCRYLNPKGEPAGVQYMVFDGVVARYDVGPLDGPAEVPVADLPRTAAGVGVGSTTAEVEAAYATRLAKEPHHYVPGGQYLIVTPADTSRRIIFETDAAGKVTSLRAGRRPQVGWIEGCS